MREEDTVAGHIEVLMGAGGEANLGWPIDALCLQVPHLLVSD